MISLSGLLYFLSLAAFFIYLNVMLISRRHWPRLAPGTPHSMHVAGRAAATLVALVAANVLVSRVPVCLTRRRAPALLSAETRQLR